MSKSRGNVVGIDETVDSYGVDAMRLFLLQGGAAGRFTEWTDEGIVGPRALYSARVARVRTRASAPRPGACPSTACRCARATPSARSCGHLQHLYRRLKSAQDETATRRFRL